VENFKEDTFGNICKKYNVPILCRQDAKNNDITFYDKVNCLAKAFHDMNAIERGIIATHYGGVRGRNKIYYVLQFWKDIGLID